MGREIKFRVWDGATQGMFSWENINACRHLALAKGLSGEFIVIPNNAKDELMQYTGQKDRHGVEIYEGDIVEHEGCFNCIGTINGHTDQLPHLRVVQWNGEDVKFDWKFADRALRGRKCSGTMLSNGPNGGFAVIGNVHENPELLEGPS